MAVLGFGFEENTSELESSLWVSGKEEGLVVDARIYGLAGMFVPS